MAGLDTSTRTAIWRISFSASRNELTSWEVTSFLLGEYAEHERRHPVFTVADSILWLSEDVDRNSAVRKLRAVKVRGRSPMPGLHTFRITADGMQVFPRIPEQQRERVLRTDRRLGTGVPGLDDMMGGGIPEGDVVMLTGPAGSGKTTFATQFIAQGLSQRETCVVAVFEEFPEAYLARAKTAPIDFAAMIEADRLAVIYLRPLDLSVDEMLAEILAQGAADRRHARRHRLARRGSRSRSHPRFAWISASRSTGWWARSPRRASRS